MDWKNLFFSFQGRINRQPYWLCAIGATIVFMVLFAAVIALFGTFQAAASTDGNSLQLSPIGWIIAVVLYIGFLWTGLAIQVKRWHDRDKSGWWVLIALVPLVGGIWAFVECGCLRGTVGPNRFGPDPLT